MHIRKTDLASEVHQRGYAIVENVFSKQELDAIVSLLNKALQDREEFPGGQDLFAIRSVLSEIPELREYLRNERFREIRMSLHT